MGLNYEKSANYYVKKIGPLNHIHGNVFDFMFGQPFLILNEKVYYQFMTVSNKSYINSIMENNNTFVLTHFSVFIKLVFS